jgi:hypothetical protein
MAGDWIKVEHTLPDKPEVLRLADELAIDQDAVTGKLLRIWIWADQNCVSGNNIPVTTSFLDRLTAFPGFAAAMRKVGWLEGRDGSLSFPRFDRHNGQTAKQRAETNRRVAKSRANKITVKAEKIQTKRIGCNADVTDSPLQKPLPEKRREECITSNEVIHPPNPPAGGNVAVVSIVIGKTSITYDEDPMRWQAEFIKRWNKLKGVNKHSANALSTSNLRLLTQRLSESDWTWQEAFTRFPLWTPNESWAPSMSWFLEPASVSKINEGRYERRSEQTGLFTGHQRPDHTRVRTGETAATLEAAFAEALAKSGGAGPSESNAVTSP